MLACESQRSEPFYVRPESLTYVIAKLMITRRDCESLRQGSSRDLLVGARSRCSSAGADSGDRHCGGWHVMGDRIGKSNEVPREVGNISKQDVIALVE
jgi:hypothetical protein